MDTAHEAAKEAEFIRSHRTAVLIATGIDAQANASSRRLDFVSVCCRSFCGRIEGGFSFGDGWFGVDRLGRRRVDHLAADNLLRPAGLA
jgi:hypothetical protein